MELKPCPFCCGKAIFRRRDTYIDTPFMYTWFSIFCEDCEVQTKEYIKIDKAIEAWNKREEHMCQQR